MAEPMYLYSLDLMEAYHFLHVSSPEEICELYNFQLAPISILIKTLLKLCVCILPNANVSVAILSCVAERILESNASPLLSALQSSTPFHSLGPEYE